MAPVKTNGRRSRSDAKKPLTPVGGRIRAARTRVGMTQQQVAGERYTKAYISALENGLVRPSVAALEYLAPRLGTTPSALLADSQPAWSRVHVDLRLASGDFQAAADGYRDLLAAHDDREARAELLCGLAEAEIRLDHPAEAVAAASEAVETFEALARPVDAAHASYWLSAGLYEQGNIADSTAILQALLAKVRTGMRVSPDFKMRLLMALSSNAARDGNFDAALSYLTEVRALEETLDDRRRATYLSDLTSSYTETGDYEAAIRAGYQAMALFRAYDTDIDMAVLENDVALAQLGSGNIAGATELADLALARWKKLGNDRHMAHVLDTQAQIALARGDAADAISLANESLELARNTNNAAAISDALLTAARATAASGPKRAAEARAAFERAAADARESGRPVALKRVLTEYADFLANQGDHRAAFELTREALGATR